MLFTNNNYTPNYIAKIVLKMTEDEMRLICDVEVRERMKQQLQAEILFGVVALPVQVEEVQHVRARRTELEVNDIHIQGEIVRTFLAR